MIFLNHGNNDSNHSRVRARHRGRLRNQRLRAVHRGLLQVKNRLNKIRRNQFIALICAGFTIGWISGTIYHWISK